MNDIFQRKPTQASTNAPLLVDTTLRALAAGANVTFSVANNVVTMSAQGQTGATGPQGPQGPAGSQGQAGSPSPTEDRKDPQVRKATRVHRGIQEHPVRQACWVRQGHQGCRVYPVPGIPSAKGDKGDKGDQGDTGDKGDPGTPADASALVTLATDQTVVGSKNFDGVTRLKSIVRVRPQASV